jgi:hypothetical protein
MQFLKNLLKGFAGWASPSELPQQPQPHETLARFLFSDQHFAETKGIVKAKAFLPDIRGETSVFRILALHEPEVWRIGNEIRAELPKARGDILVNLVLRSSLRVDPATEEHERHAVITGWPSEKHQKLAVATQLSSQATLRMLPRKPTGLFSYICARMFGRD